MRGSVPVARTTVTACCICNAIFVHSICLIIDCTVVDGQGVYLLQSELASKDQAAHARCMPRCGQHDNGHRLGHETDRTDRTHSSALQDWTAITCVLMPSLTAQHRWTRDAHKDWSQPLQPCKSVHDTHDYSNTSSTRSTVNIWGA